MDYYMTGSRHFEDAAEAAAYRVANNPAIMRPYEGSEGECYLVVTLSISPIQPGQMIWGLTEDEKIFLSVLPEEWERHG